MKNKVFSISNIGLRNIANIELSLYEDLNNDSSYSNGELLDTSILISDTLYSGATIEKSVVFDSLSSGNHRFIGVASILNDENQTNNVSIVEIKIGYQN